MTQDPHDAAEEAVADDRLLAGENPTTTRLDEAVHWSSVYSELVTFKEIVLGTTRRQMDAMQTDSRAEVEATDLPILEAEASRLHRRFSYWQGRVADLRT